MLTDAPGKAFGPQIASKAAIAVASSEAQVSPEQPVHATPLAARFTDILAHLPDISPLHVLIMASDALVPLPRFSMGGTPAQGGGKSAIEARVDTACPCVRFLRRVMPSTEYRPLMIAHSLLGDHGGYGPLWSKSLHQHTMFALRHRGLDGDDTSALDRSCAMSMAGGYAAALVATDADCTLAIAGAHVVSAALVSNARSIEVSAGSTPATTAYKGTVRGDQQKQPHRFRAELKALDAPFVTLKLLSRKGDARTLSIDSLEIVVDAARTPEAAPPPPPARAAATAASASSSSHQKTLLAGAALLDAAERRLTAHVDCLLYTSPSPRD